MKNLEFQVEKLSKLAHYLFQQSVFAALKKCTEPQLIDCGQYVANKIHHFTYPFNACVQIFPRQWKLNATGDLYWIHDESKTTLTSALGFFGLSFFMFSHLFIPGEQNVRAYGGKELSEKSKPYHVAENIMALIKTINIQKN